MAMYVCVAVCMYVCMYVCVAVVSFIVISLVANVVGSRELDKPCMRESYSRRTGKQDL